ncbi:RING finger protein 141 [Amphibalanus amphitrite]|uniref:RING finger protein 141 n=1 Tax=Amphibalanus amphitrite TaxID=1232801 RepID=A0A6A4V0J9_AMPAM|nr:RING finger protein 141-like [Amphibalanus amphitrite]XP_043240784.1 RING finger protein 141-like [Amphibalanus amphitrite]XP_043240785.1 RING finger protein 141-like [Amphibalanus amphitrite]XP_043240786.1 RING finger protein 141-like [Amphibalanus amphitrite]KAF0288246.1 RING finger protein 141 [Amphibalanus amphitrite]
MGQSDSSPLSAPVLRARDTVLRRAAPLHQLTTMPYDQLLARVDSLNALCDQLRDGAGRRLRFVVDAGSAAAPVLWRGLVRIDCERLSAGGLAEARRPLSLRQFLQARATLQQQHAWLTAQAPAGATAPCTTRLLDALDSDDGCCCICLERRPDTSLPCAHAYCAVCIEEWSGGAAHRPCPMCRQQLSGTDDAWVLAEAPSCSQLRHQVATSLMQLATEQR